MATAETCELLCLDLDKAESLRQQRPPASAVEAAAGLAQALGDPTRLGLAVALADGGELCVCDLAWVAERPEKLVSHHVRALRAAGLARSRRDGRMVMYALTDAGRQAVEAVLSSATATAR